MTKEEIYISMEDITNEMDLNKNATDYPLINL